MPDTVSHIVVTGAHSWLGSRIVTRLRRHGDTRVSALVTPWATGNVIDDSHAADLSGPVSAEAADLIATADQVFHFAWARPASLDEAIGQNGAMLDTLLSSLQDPSRLVFISSVGASASTTSRYGASKWHLAERVLNAGGCVVVCGLVVDTPPRGPHKMLADVVRRLPFGMRFTGAPIPTYPVPISALDALADAELQPGAYRLFPLPATPLNELLAGLDGQRRIRVPIPTAAVLAGSRFLPGRLGDKIRTFLTKDAAYLESLPPVPGV